MPISARVESIDRDIDLIFKETLSPAARSAMLASAAQEQLQQAEQQNQSVLGRIPPHHTFIDGVEGAGEETVRPDGVIVYEFTLIGELFIWIADKLKEFAPVGGGKDPHPGLYRSSFTFYADGVEVNVGGDIPPGAQEYVFVSSLPYARTIEQGSSSQAPEGVFEAVAALGRQRFGNLVKIEFTYRGIVGLTSGAGTLVNPLLDPTRGNRKGQGSKAYNKSDVRFPCIVVTVR